MVDICVSLFRPGDMDSPVKVCVCVCVCFVVCMSVSICAHEQVAV